MEIKEAEENENVERRENKRYSIPAVVKCKLFEEVVSGKNSFQGFIQDISFGGVSLEITDDFLNIKEDLLKYTNVEMELELNSPDGLHRMNFSGIIKWHKRVKKKDKNVLTLHIQFHYLDEKSAEVLMKYLSLGSGDKNLFWNLWDNLSTYS
jgi:hypothetical protein